MGENNNVITVQSNEGGTFNVIVGGIEQAAANAQEAQAAFEAWLSNQSSAPQADGASR